MKIKFIVLIVLASLVTVAMAKTVVTADTTTAKSACNGPNCH